MKKFITAIIIIAITLTGTMPVWAEDNAQQANRLARVNATYDYLNEVYLTNDELAFDIDYVSDEDVEILTSLAYYLTGNYTTDYAKAVAIFEWISTLGYSYNNFTAIDVFRNMGGVCSGRSQLGSTLLRLIGIRCAVVRGNKISIVNDASRYTAHEWVMAYVNNNWVLFDTLFGNYTGVAGISNKEIMAEYYEFSQVDGILPVFDNNIYNNKDEVKKNNTYYVNGEYIGYINGELTNYAGASLSVGGCLTYSRWYENGYAKSGGIYYNADGSPYIIKCNGIRTQKLFANIDNTNYFINDNAGIIIDSSFNNNGFTNGRLNMYIGETVTLDNSYTYIKTSDTNVIIEDYTVTAISSGNADIHLGNGKTLEIYVYGDVINSNELFQALCDHDCTHEVNGEDYCDYCGLHIETVEEETTEEPIEEETVEEEVVETEEETVEEETPEEIIEETIEEEPTQEVEETPEEEETQEVEEVETPEEIIPEEVENTPIEEEITPEEVQEVATPEEEIVEEPIVEETVKETTEPIEEEEVVEEEPIETPEETVEETETVEEVVKEVVEEVEETETPIAEEPETVSVPATTPNVTILLCQYTDVGQLANVEVVNGEVYVKVNINTNCNIKIIMVNNNYQPL